MTFPSPAVAVLLFGLVITAAIYDIRVRRIPNWLTVSGVVTGFALNWFLYEEAGLVMSAKGLGIALLVYFPLFLLRAMGAGDAKLMAAVGSIVGAANWLGVFFCSAILGGIFGLFCVIFRGRFLETLTNISVIFRSLMHLQPPYVQSAALDMRSPKAFGFPHGAVIALGSVAFIVAGAVWAPR